MFSGCGFTEDSVALTRSRVLAVSLVLLFSVGNSAARVPNPTILAKVPIPPETVNPADGSFTFDVPLKSPPGRQLGFPLDLRYTSYEQYYLGSNGTSGVVKWWPISNAPLLYYGWSYLIPGHSAQAYTYSSYPNPNANPRNRSYLSATASATANVRRTVPGHCPRE